MSEKQNELKLIRMSDVAVEEIKWLWYPYIPYGKITVIQGDPGDGKTTVVLAIAAAVTKGLTLPGQKEPSEPIDVIFQTAEDGLGDTVKPRLLQANADCGKVIVIDESKKELTLSDTRIEQALHDTGAKLIIIDPLQAYLGAEVDMHRANEIRPILKRISLLAERTGCAVIFVGHLNKGTKRYGFNMAACAPSEYLRWERPALYAELLLTERLYPLCREVDEAAAHRLTVIGNRETAHEVILSELVYI